MFTPVVIFKRPQQNILEFTHSECVNFEYTLVLYITGVRGGAVVGGGTMLQTGRMQVWFIGIFDW